MHLATFIELQSSTKRTDPTIVLLLLFNIWRRDPVFLTLPSNKDHLKQHKNYISRRSYHQNSMARRIDQSNTSCFDCVYIYHYTVNQCSHTICNNCLRAAVEEKIDLQLPTFICPRCPDSEERQNRLRIVAQENTTTIVDHRTAEITSDSTWPNGIESWHFHEMKAQRELFVEKDRLEKLLNQHQVAKEHEMIENVNDDELNIQLQHLQETFSAKLAEKQKIIEQLLIQLQLNFQELINGKQKQRQQELSSQLIAHNNDSNTDSGQQNIKQGEGERNDSIKEVTEENEEYEKQLGETQDQHRTTTQDQQLNDDFILPTSNDQQEDDHNTKMGCSTTIQSKLVSTTNSNYNSHNTRRTALTQLLQPMGKSLARLLIFLLSILIRMGYMYTSTNNALTCFAERTRTYGLTFPSGIILPIGSKEHLDGSTTFVRTIEVLRNLESLLIYDIT